MLFNILGFLTFVLTISALADQGDGKTVTTVTATTVYITVTSKGVTTVIPTLYSQTFMTTYTDANTDDVQSGDIGLGSSATGSLGGIRSYDQTTISNIGNINNAYGALGGVGILIGCLL